MDWKSRSVYRLVASWLHMHTQFLALRLSNWLSIRKEKVNEVNTWKQGAKYKIIACVQTHSPKGRRNKITNLVQRNKHISAHKSYHGSVRKKCYVHNAHLIPSLQYGQCNIPPYEICMVPSNFAEDITQIFLLILLCTSKTSFNHKYLFSGIFEDKN